MLKDKLVQIKNFVVLNRYEILGGLAVTALTVGCVVLANCANQLANENGHEENGPSLTIVDDDDETNVLGVFTPTAETWNSWQGDPKDLI